MAVKQFTNDYGITLVDEKDVPPPPRQNDRNPELWKAVTLILQNNPNTWAVVKEYDKAGSAGAKAANINGDKNKSFPAKDWEARYTKTDDSSVLFMRYVGPPVSEKPADKG